jgi:hypothetical protein
MSYMCCETEYYIELLPNCMSDLIVFTVETEPATQKAVAKTVWSKQSKYRLIKRTWHQSAVQYTLWIMQDTKQSCIVHRTQLIAI